MNKNTESEIWFSQFGLFHTNSLTRNSTISVFCITLRLSLAKRVIYIYQHILTSTTFIFSKSRIHFPLPLYYELNGISFRMYKTGFANTNHNFTIGIWYDIIKRYNIKWFHNIRIVNVYFLCIIKFIKWFLLTDCEQIDCNWDSDISFFQ